MGSALSPLATGCFYNDIMRSTTYDVRDVVRPAARKEEHKDAGSGLFRIKSIYPARKRFPSTLIGQEASCISVARDNSVISLL